MQNWKDKGDIGILPTFFNGVDLKLHAIFNSGSYICACLFGDIHLKIVNGGLRHLSSIKLLAIGSHTRPITTESKQAEMRPCVLQSDLFITKSQTLSRYLDACENK